MSRIKETKEYKEVFGDSPPFDKEKQDYAKPRLCAVCGLPEQFHSEFVSVSPREETMAAFRNEILDAVWGNTVVSNFPHGVRWSEWAPEFIIPRGKEKAVDEAIDAALMKVMERLR